MAQQVQIILIDDIDGGPAVETIPFALDGVTYEMDLSAVNAARLRNAMAPFVGHARKVARSGNRRGKAGAQPNRSSEIRQWARSQGLKVNERGRIPAELVAKFEASH